MILFVFFVVLDMQSIEKWWKKKQKKIINYFEKDEKKPKKKREKKEKNWKKRKYFEKARNIREHEAQSAMKNEKANRSYMLDFAG